MSTEPVAEETKSDDAVAATIEAMLRMEPAIRHHYRVVGFGVERVPKGDAVELHLNFLVSPIEAIVIEMPEENKADLIQALTGGIVIPEIGRI